MSDFMKGVKNKRIEELKNELVAAEQAKADHEGF